MATETAIHIASDETITLTGLTAGGGYLNAATVTWELNDTSGNAVTGGSGSLTYDTGSNGDYTGVIESTVTTLLTYDETYYVDITISSGSYNDFRRLPRVAKYRAED